MKALFITALTMGISVTTAAASATPVMTCGGLEIYQQDQRGNGSFQAAGVDIEISASAAGKFGYEAKYISANGTQSETDVEISLAPPQDTNELKEISALMYPQIQWSEVAQVRVGNVGVTANRQDSAGTIIYELLGVNQSILGKVVQSGWSFGRCK